MTEIYSGERILLPEFVRRRVTDDQAWVIEGVLFERCQLVGPAVLVSSDPDSGFRLDHPTFPGTSKPSVVLWEMAPTQRSVVGAIGVTGCDFNRCSFVGVGFAAPPETIEQLRRGLG